MYRLSQSGARLVSVVRISEAKGVRFSEVSNVLALRSFNPSASRRVRYERFHCIPLALRVLRSIIIYTAFRACTHM